MKTAIIQTFCAINDSNGNPRRIAQVMLLEDLEVSYIPLKHTTVTQEFVETFVGKDVSVSDALVDFTILYLRDAYITVHEYERLKKLS